MRNFINGPSYSPVHVSTSSVPHTENRHESRGAYVHCGVHMVLTALVHYDKLPDLFVMQGIFGDLHFNESEEQLQLHGTNWL